jgi:hypothetical protein
MPTLGGDRVQAFVKIISTPFGKGYLIIIRF